MRGAGDEDEDRGPGEEGPEEGAAVGDLVVIPVPRVRAQVGCGERAGVVLEDRRGVVKAYFPEIDRAFWLDRDRVRSIPEGRIEVHPLTLRLHRLCRVLEAVGVEIEEKEGDATVFHVSTRGTTLDALLRAREMLGPDFRRMGVDPGGVRRARVTLVFRTGL